jgi:hypothetical protein
MEPVFSLVIAISHEANAISSRPTASFILAQGNALGNQSDHFTQPEGLPHHPA